jgi:hypothetical protein
MLGYRQTRYYDQVRKALLALGKSEKDIRSVAISKGALIVQLGKDLNRRNVDMWLGKAASLTRENLKKEIKAFRRKRAAARRR